MKLPEWFKPVIGGLVIGAIGLYFPEVFGTGLKTIENALHGNLVFSLLLALIFLKIIATSLSLGSGSSGGVFAPDSYVDIGGSVNYYGAVFGMDFVHNGGPAIHYDESLKDIPLPCNVVRLRSWHEKDTVLA